MTSPEATLASAAREVTLYLAFVSPRSSSLALAGPVPSPPSIPLRTRSGSVAATPGSRDRAHGLLEHLHDERPHVDRRAGAFAVGGRIRRQRGLEVAEDSAWTSSRTAPGLTGEPFFAHFRAPSWNDQCAPTTVSPTRVRRPRRATQTPPSIVMGTPRLVRGPDPPRLQREQWPRPLNRWPPCRRGQGAAPIHELVTRGRRHAAGGGGSGPAPGAGPRADTE